VVKGIVMPVKHIIKIALVKSETTLTNVLKEINSDRGQNKQISLQSLNQRINRGTLRYDDAEEIAKTLGYKIAWVKENEFGVYKIDKDLT
jgi:hypothetical protein